MESKIQLLDVTPANSVRTCFFCAKNPKTEAFKAKNAWFEKEYAKGLRLKIVEVDGKQVGFIEYTPIEHAWRPVVGENYLFIHCLYIYPNKHRNQGLASLLLSECELEANDLGLEGVCTFTSDGPWMTRKDLFLRNGYRQTDKHGRYELLVKKFNPEAPDPEIFDWTKGLKDYQGWHLLYADQCPWNEKCVAVIAEKAFDEGLDLRVKKLTTPEQARRSPSGFGVFNLIHDGKLLADHYISHTRFRNILKEELAG